MQMYSYLGVATARLSPRRAVPFQENRRGPIVGGQLAGNCEANDACANDLWRVSRFVV